MTDTWEHGTTGPVVAAAAHPGDRRGPTQNYRRRFRRPHNIGCVSSRHPGRLRGPRDTRHCVRNPIAQRDRRGGGTASNPSAPSGKGRPRRLFFVPFWARAATCATAATPTTGGVPLASPVKATAATWVRATRCRIPLRGRNSHCALIAPGRQTPKTYPPCMNMQSTTLQSRSSCDRMPTDIDPISSSTHENSKQRHEKPAGSAAHSATSGITAANGNAKPTHVGLGGGDRTITERMVTCRNPRGTTSPHRRPGRRTGPADLDLYGSETFVRTAVFAAA